MATSSDEAWRKTNEALIHDGEFDEVLGNSSGHEVILIGLADSAQEAQGTRRTESEVEHSKHVALCLENLILRVTVLNHVLEFMDGRANDFFILGSAVESCDTNQLKLSQRDSLYLKEAVDAIDQKVEGLWKESETAVDLNNPIQEDRAH